MQQTVSEVERGRRRVTATELFSLTLVPGATIGDLFGPIGRGRNWVGVEFKDVEQ